MRVIAVTHATAEQEPPRGLSKLGISEAVEVANAIRNRCDEIAPVAVLTSPRKRCMDTVSVICETLSLTAESFEPQEIEALGEWGLSLDILTETLRTFASLDGNDTILVCLHADLSNALCASYPLSPASVVTSFNNRPILAVLDYTASGTYLYECLELHDMKWKDLVAAKRGKDGTVAIGTWPTPE